MTQIIELLTAALLGGLVTMAISWLLVGGKIKVMRTGLQHLQKEFTVCHEGHADCPERIKDECQGAIKALALVVDEHVKTTTLLSTTLNAHLQVTQQLDAATEKRFARIEDQLNRIEHKLDQLKGWKMVQP